MAADWDSSSGAGVHADVVTVSETGASTGDYDVGDIDPDLANYDGGNDPDTAYRTQGTPDSPDRLDNIAGADPDDGSEAAYGDSADEYGELPATSESGQVLDMWGDTDPDAANYADLDGIGAGSPDRHDAQSGDDADADHQDHAQQADASVEHVRTPDQERIDALEAENAESRQQLADANQKIGTADQKIAGLEAELKAVKDEQGARLDRLEQLLAAQRPAENGRAPDQVLDKSSAPVDQHEIADSAPGRHLSEIAEKKDGDVGVSGDDAEHHGWRHLTSTENVGLAGAVVGATDVVAQFAMHASPEGMIGLTAAAISVAAAYMAKWDKKKEEKRK
jgi:hypothetical protein